MRMLFSNCSTGPIADPFAGSGTSFIVGEQIGRRVDGCEIDPVNCDIIVERWQKFTGKTALNESAGRTFDESKAKTEGR